VKPSSTRSGAGIVVFWVVVALAWRARRKGGSLRAGVVGANYDLLSAGQTPRHGLVVEEKAEGKAEARTVTCRS
jgi:hypothetical protein